jgi:hypothetical protein
VLELREVNILGVIFFFLLGFILELFSWEV